MKAQANRGVCLEELNWLEAMAKFEAGAVVVIPIGAIAKEHGPHLPLDTGWLIARELAARRVTDYGDFLDRPASVFQRPGVMTVSRSGAFRDPTLATQEKGEAILAAMSQDLVAGLRHGFPAALGNGGK